jgi:hypothetical protein
MREKSKKQLLLMHLTPITPKPGNWKPSASFSMPNLP